MKGKSAASGLPRGEGLGRDDEALAVGVLGCLVRDPDRLERFLSLTGLSPDTIRQSAGEPGFLAAVLDHVCSDEELLVAVAGEIDSTPAAIDAARARLSPAVDYDP